MIRGLGKQAGVSLCPATPLASVAHVLDRLDLILVMTVNPGFGGQRFIEAMLDKLRALRGMIGGRDIYIQVDGGINPETAPLARAAGADVLVAGSAIFGREDYAEAIAALRPAA
jgi:ribulose-phosphate 3-epimerase